jgi:hypothetical protein
MPLPAVRVTIAAPEPLLRERSFLRMHNKAAKEALREQGLFHWKNRIPGHFPARPIRNMPTAARSPATCESKPAAGGARTDLVKTGHLKSDMLNTPPVIRIGGKASDDNGDGGDLKLLLVLPFHVGDKAQPAIATWRSNSAAAR